MADLRRLFNMTIVRQTKVASYSVFGVGLELSPAPGFYGVTKDNFESITPDDVSSTVKVYTTYDDVIDDGVKGAALKAANAYFAQNPKPDSLVMADISGAFSSVAILLNGDDTGIKDVTAALATVVGAEVLHATFDGTAWTGTAAASITADENDPSKYQVAGRLVFVAGAGVSVGYSVVKADSFTGVITDIRHQNDNWFMSFTTSRNPTLLTQIADWTEAQTTKMSNLIDDGGAVYSSDPKWPLGGITQYLFDKQYAGSFATTTRVESNYLDAALAGRCLTMQPGSETWALKTLSGVVADNFTETDYQTITAINGNTFENYGSGVIVSYPGTCGDGEAIEVVRFCYWLADYMQKNMATMTINQKKLFYAPSGIEQVCMNMEASLKTGQDNGGILENFSNGTEFVRGFTVTRPTMKQITAAQQIKGNLSVYFEFYLNYAIKHVDGIGTALTWGM
ncbi:DUF3383 domain-containing protein [Buttiauxella sp. B2]|uniref:DUF3383 family protein n=1 Tax=Buttiauxella sp. B2 TaxID=2587812 RepID=UPI00111D1E55|nr:DUF3383 family protein [Buttiauxella sp. B2]TNV17879.1 DUF3383 domain-containing protein [Buttiauxella sp. B2]